MNSISSLSPASLSPGLASLASGSLTSESKPGASLRATEKASPEAGAVAKAGEIREAFTAFIGETFYGQMMKAMRSTVEKPAYFHGGQGEEIFSSQLDQQLAQEWAATSGDRFADPMFEQQFPEQARILREAEQASADTKASPFDALQNLRRR